MTYSKKIIFSGIWLDNSGCLITQWKTFINNSLSRGSKFWGKTKKVIKVRKVSGKNNILTFEEKQVSFIGNKKKIILDMTS